MEHLCSKNKCANVVKNQGDLCYDHSIEFDQLGERAKSLAERIHEEIQQTITECLKP